jgi:hypothetical protein
MCAGLDLRQRVGGDAAEVAGSHLGGEDLAPGGIDPLADDDERPVEADDDFAGRRADDGIGHEAVSSRVPVIAVAPRSSTPCARISRSSSTSV